MSGAARTAVLVIGGAAMLGGLALGMLEPGGFWLAVVGAVVMASVVFEGRYRTGDRLGKAGASAGWQETGEREIDSETGEPMAVWFNPASGARRYLPIGRRP